MILQHLLSETMLGCYVYPWCLSVVVGGGWRWLEVVAGRRGGGRGRRGEQDGRGGRGFVLGITRGGWRWLEVVELDEVEDEDSCSFCAPPSDPLVHILRRDIAVLRIKKKRFIKMQIAPLFLPLCFQPLLWCVFKIKDSICII
ncbi:uncharacterized protein [Neodiprion pinetum]|uniref:uncharacterized protein n=1 Tax=Neodiprion pinetum TaxID=441929 RepID=UPI00371DA920